MKTIKHSIIALALFAVLGATASDADPAAIQAKNLKALNQLAGMTLMHVGDNRGAFPENADALKLPAKFTTWTNPADGSTGTYIYCGAGLRDDVMNPDKLISWYAPATYDGKRLIATVDGRARDVAEAEFQAMAKAQKLTVAE